MADQSTPVDTSVNPRIIGASVENPCVDRNNLGTSGSNVELDKDRYIQQLHSELRIMRERLWELEQKSNQSVPVVSEIERMTVLSQYQFPRFQPSPVELNKKCSFTQFMDCRPPYYSGSSDVAVILNWLKDVDKALEACQCETELRVLYASRLLKDEALVWWNSIIAQISEEQRKSISWEQFCSRICIQHCTTLDLGSIRQELWELEMDDTMTVDELIECYKDKLRFAYHWIPDEQSRIRHFVDALLPEYRNMVGLATTLSQAFAMAKMAESDMIAGIKRRTERMVQQKREEGQSNLTSSRLLRKKQKRKSTGSISAADRVVRCRQCRVLHSGLCSAQTRRCLRCGIVGHEAQTCLYEDNVCWNCQEEGHLSNHCPSAKGVDSGSGSGVQMRSVVESSVSTKGQKRKETFCLQGLSLPVTAANDDMTGTYFVKLVPNSEKFDFESHA